MSVASLEAAAKAVAHTFDRTQVGYGRAVVTVGSRAGIARVKHARKSGKFDYYLNNVRVGRRDLLAALG